MAKPVTLTPIAEENLERVIGYLFAKWGIHVVNDFTNRYEKVIRLLEENPRIFPYHDKKSGIQKCFLTKHNLIYFHDSEFQISIITIFDTRQDPEKLKRLF